MEILNYQETEESEVSFEMLLEGEEWNLLLEKASRKMQLKSPVPGCRSGRAPLPKAICHYGNKLFRSAASLAAEQSLQKACRDHGLMPVTVPQFRSDRTDDAGCEVFCCFVTYPKLTELDYRGLEPEKPVRVCSDEDIRKAIDNYMLQHLDVHEVAREARTGDIVELSFQGTCKGEPFPFDHSAQFRLKLGSGILFAGLDEELEGHRAGENLSVMLTMPEDFHREEVAGKTLDLEIHIRSVWAKDLLTCTDEYVREHVKGCESLSEFRELQRKRIQEQFDRESERQYMANLERLLAENVRIHVPEAMVEAAIRRYISGLESISAQNGKTAVETLQEEGKTMNDYIAMCRPSALLQVKKSIALDYIIQREEISVSGKEADHYVRTRAASAQMPPEEMLRRLGGIEDLKEELLQEKAFRIVAESARPQIIYV